ncbi:hypothetical protein AVEN_192689-1 [Araneus ventricosus]|uniref:Uncharacterized protein n=1 Tax=Araneus ventricosus TaxID=182803 RepID=A0A4Y2HUK8_ARAVE|nr:hypothetical protein AVEN_192689-1 [Araneus ventricosus]
MTDKKEVKNSHRPFRASASFSANRRISMKLTNLAASPTDVTRTSDSTPITEISVSHRKLSSPCQKRNERKSPDTIMETKIQFKASSKLSCVSPTGRDRISENESIVETAMQHLAG